MKRLGRVLGSLLAVALTVFTMQAFAAAQTGGRDFNHMTTGFILSGGHAVAACETCHIGGVFKGTPKACDGCHAVGSRIVATPKSTSHIVTDAPCESCHFNTATWLGARYNHGNALPDQCVACHNGRIQQGKPASHSTGNKAINGCGSCHRTSAWLPAFNHVNVVPGTCVSCHNGNPTVGKTASHTGAKGTLACDDCHRQTTSWLPAAYTHRNVVPGSCVNCHNGSISRGKPTLHTGAKGTYACDECHRTSAWLPANFNHLRAGTCASCHNGSVAIGKTNTHTGAKGTLACDDCHIKAAWLPAAYTHRNVVPGSCSTCHNGSPTIGKTPSHTGAKGTYACDECHRTSAWLPANFNHLRAGTCASCHNGSVAIGKTNTHTAPKLKGTAACDDCHVKSAWLPAAFKHNTAAACSSCHNGSIAGGKLAGHVATTDECNQCHIGNASWTPALGGKPTNHIPYNAAAKCSNCHTGLAKVNINVLHSFSIASNTCATCHISTNPYQGNNQETKRSHEGSSGNNCTQSGCHTKGAASYLNWDE